MDKTNLKIIITGVTGMVGEGVLHECLRRKDVQKILIIGRRPYGINHPKVEEVVHENFHDLSAIESELSGFDACFFCLGVSSVGMNEQTYKHLTYDLTMHVATTLSKLNPAMTFCYISGTGTDSSEKGKLMWARVKGKTENDLQKLPFKAVFNFRPGIIEPTKGLKNTLKLYTWMGWLIPIIRIFTTVITLHEIGQAMVNVVSGYAKNILEVEDIRTLARKGAR
jgi:uncharacterized protein YbjT (DUF2867 family)